MTENWKVMIIVGINEKDVIMAAILALAVVCIKNANLILVKLMSRKNEIIKGREWEIGKEKSCIP